jgi:hypothetical protein
LVLINWQKCKKNKKKKIKKSLKGQPWCCDWLFVCLFVCSLICLFVFCKGISDNALGFFFFSITDASRVYYMSCFCMDDVKCRTLCCGATIVGVTFYFSPSLDDKHTFFFIFWLVWIFILLCFFLEPLLNDVTYVEEVIGMIWVSDREKAHFQWNGATLGLSHPVSQLLLLSHWLGHSPVNVLHMMRVKVKFYHILKLFVSQSFVFLVFFLSRSELKRKTGRWPLERRIKFVW